MSQLMLARIQRKGDKKWPFQKKHFTSKWTQKVLIRHSGSFFKFHPQTIFIQPFKFESFSTKCSIFNSMTSLSITSVLILEFYSVRRIGLCSCDELPLCKI